MNGFYWRVHRNSILGGKSRHKGPEAGKCIQFSGASRLDMESGWWGGEGWAQIFFTNSCFLYQLELCHHHPVLSCLEIKDFFKWSGQHVITGTADRIQAKSKRLDVLIYGAALSSTHVWFPLACSSIDSGLGGEPQSLAWVLVLLLLLPCCVRPVVSLSFLLVEWKQLSKLGFRAGDVQYNSY